jgi:AraC family transcriptional regulator
MDIIKLLFEVTREHPWPRTVIAGTESEAGRILPVLDYIHQNLARKITIADAAREAALGQTKFIKTFKQVMGVPFARYVLNNRLEGARKDLMEEHQKLATVAKTWGFYDSSHLLKQYQKYFKKTPGEERAPAVNLAKL